MSKDITPREKAVKLLEDRWIIKAMGNEDRKNKLAAKNAHGTKVSLQKTTSWHSRTKKD